MNNTIAIGREILNSTTSGTYAGQSTSVYIGHEVGKNVGATSNYGASVWIGYQAGLNRGGAAPYNTTLIGCQAGTGGYSSVAIGKSAMTNGGVGSIGIGTICRIQQLRSLSYIDWRYSRSFCFLYCNYSYRI